MRENEESQFMASEKAREESFKVVVKIKSVKSRVAKGPYKIRTMERVSDTLTNKLPGPFHGHIGVLTVYSTCVLEVTSTLNFGQLRF